MLGRVSARAMSSACSTVRPSPALIPQATDQLSYLAFPRAQYLAERCGHVRVGACGLFVDRDDVSADLELSAVYLGKHVQLLDWICLTERSSGETDRARLGHPVLGDLLEDACLAAEGRVDRLHRDAGLPGDGGDRCCQEAVLGEESPRCLSNLLPGLFGLALSVARAVVDRHVGKVSVWSS